MSIADWIIVAILIGAVLAGLAQGFFRSVCGLGGLVLGLVLAAWNYDRFAVVIKHLVHSQMVANAIAFLLIAVIVMGVAGILGSLLSKMFQKVGLGCLDRLAGAIFGFFQGALLVMLGILVTVAFFPQTQWLTQSRLPKYFFGACHLSTNISPSGLGQRVRDELNRLEQVSPTWMHPGKTGA